MALIPNADFTPGQVIDASDLNDKFSAVASLSVDATNIARRSLDTNSIADATYVPGSAGGPVVLQAGSTYAYGTVQSVPMLGPPPQPNVGVAPGATIDIMEQITIPPNAVLLISFGAYVDSITNPVEACALFHVLRYDGGSATWLPLPNTEDPATTTVIRLGANDTSGLQDSSAIGIYRYQSDVIDPSTGSPVTVVYENMGVFRIYAWKNDTGSAVTYDGLRLELNKANWDFNLWVSATGWEDQLEGRDGTPTIDISGAYLNYIVYQPQG